MLLIAGSIRFDAAHRDELSATALVVLRDLRARPGCTHFALSADLEDPDVVHLIQKWESPEALLQSMATPRSDSERRAHDVGLREMTLVRYDVAAAQPVGPGNARSPSASAIAIAIAGELRIDLSRREDATALAIELMAEARTSKGCTAYVIGADVEDPGLLRVFGEWESRDSLRAHMIGPSAEASRKRLDAVGVREISLARFHIRSSGPLV